MRWVAANDKLERLRRFCFAYKYTLAAAACDQAAGGTDALREEVRAAAPFGGAPTQLRSAAKRSLLVGQLWAGSACAALMLCRRLTAARLRSRLRCAGEAARGRHSQAGGRPNAAGVAEGGAGC